MRKVFIKQCFYCNNSFETYNSKRKFCSNSCSSRFNKTGGDHVSLKSFIDKYGKVIGNKKYQKFVNKLIQIGKKNCNIKFVSTEEVKQKISKGVKQSEYHKNRKGKPLSETERERISKSMKGWVNTLPWFIEKFGQVEGSKKYKERIALISEKSHFRIYNKTDNKKNYSKISQELFWEIYKRNKELENEKVYFGELNHEHSCFCSHCCFDFVTVTQKKFIEFYGDKFHANPLFYERIDQPNPYSKWTTEQIWQFDKTKFDMAIKNGFSGMIVWEYDFKNNREKVIQDCLTFLSERLL